jgi:hypothetical protein
VKYDYTHLVNNSGTRPPKDGFGPNGVPKYGILFLQENAWEMIAGKPSIPGTNIRGNMDIIKRASKYPEFFGLDIRVEWSDKPYSVVLWPDIFFRDNEKVRGWIEKREACYDGITAYWNSERGNELIQVPFDEFVRNNLDKFLPQKKNPKVHTRKVTVPSRVGTSSVSGTATPVLNAACFPPKAPSTTVSAPSTTTTASNTTATASGAASLPAAPASGSGVANPGMDTRSNVRFTNAWYFISVY